MGGIGTKGGSSTKDPADTSGESSDTSEDSSDIVVIVVVVLVLLAAVCMGVAYKLNLGGVAVTIKTKLGKQDKVVTEDPFRFKPGIQGFKSGIVLQNSHYADAEDEDQYGAPQAFKGVGQ